MAQLIVSQAERVVRVVELTKVVLTLSGRPEADVTLPDLSARSGRLVATRFGSSLDIRVDGDMRLEVGGQSVDRYTLAPGDTVEVPPYTLKLAGSGAHDSTVKAGPRAAHRPALDAFFTLIRHCHRAVDSVTLLDGLMHSLLGAFGAQRGFILLSPGELEADGVPPKKVRAFAADLGVRLRKPVGHRARSFHRLAALEVCPDGVAGAQEWPNGLRATPLGVG